LTPNRSDENLNAINTLASQKTLMGNNILIEVAEENESNRSPDVRIRGG
jgi:hypothetical protein